MKGQLIGQCSSGGASWLNGQNDGVYSDTGILGGYVQVIARTVGTMSSGRPLYRTGSSTWKSLPYQSLQVWRAYSSPASNYTYFKLDTPLDSGIMHVRVDNIRGDFPNLETQSVRGYLNGVEVAASFRDPVNGATNSGDRIIGGSSTNSTVQSSMRVFFHGPVDSIVVRQASLSDWIIAELMIQCDILLPLSFEYWRAQRSGSVNVLSWRSAGEPTTLHRFDVERSDNQQHFRIIGSLQALGGTTRYQWIDSFPMQAVNYYRLRMVYKDGYAEYSDIRLIDLRNKENSLIRIYPNPAATSIEVKTNDPGSRIWVFSADGKTVQGPLAAGSSTTLDCSGWARGTYLLLIEGKRGYHTERVLLR
jgi:hypothetical protein